MNPSVLERINKVIIDSAGLDADEVLTAETALMGAGLALDSMATVELLVGLEKEFSIQIPPDELVEAGAFKTVGSLTAFIEARL